MSKSVPLHRNTVEGIVFALKSIFEGKKYAHKVVEQLFYKNRKWGKRDRAFVANGIYEIVRHWRRLWTLQANHPSTKTEDLFTLFGVWWLNEGNALPDWPEFESIQDFDLEQAISDLPEDIAIRESFPKWLNDLAQEELNGEWPEIARKLNLPAPLCIRVNTSLTTVKELQEKLLLHEIESTLLAEFPEALEINSRRKLTALPEYKNGLFEIQDVGSQLIAPFLQAQPNDIVIDACAGAGGKALHLATLMKNQGEIIALDTIDYKLEELQKRASKSKVDIISAAVVDLELVRELKESADKLLIDAPCSGTGVIKRDVDTKWKFNQVHLANNIALQQDILRQYHSMLKPGGTLVYATCSILPSENEKQTKWFLDTFGDRFELEEEKRFNPGEKNDGFYMARFKKIL